MRSGPQILDCRFSKLCTRPFPDILCGTDTTATDLFHLLFPSQSSVCSKIVQLLGQNEVDYRQKQVVIVSQDSFYRVLTSEQKSKALKGQFNFDHPGEWRTAQGWDEGWIASRQQRTFHGHQEDSICAWGGSEWLSLSLVGLGALWPLGPLASPARQPLSLQESNCLWECLG